MHLEFVCLNVKQFSSTVSDISHFCFVFLYCIVIPFYSHTGQTKHKSLSIFLSIKSVKLPGLFFCLLATDLILASIIWYKFLRCSLSNPKNNESSD